MLVQRIADNHIEIKAPAKINLFLEVLNRREDGYHNINSLFQAISLFDRLEFKRSDSPGLQLSIAGCKELPSGDDNLISRAFRMMRDEFGIDTGLEVSLEKDIPVAAGLGGGSSDGAATIMACNILFNLKLPSDIMMRLGLRVGSDLPFFFSGGQALVSGRGEIVRETHYSTEYWVVLVKPDWPVSTESAYERLKRGLTIFKEPFNLAAGPRVEELVKSLQLYGNDFEKVHIESFSELEEIRDGLLRCGAALVRMTGSGPTLFGIFYCKPDATGGQAFQWEGRQLYTVMPITFPSQA